MSRCIKMSYRLAMTNDRVLFEVWRKKTFNEIGERKQQNWVWCRRCFDRTVSWQTKLLICRVLFWFIARNPKVMARHSFRCIHERKECVCVWDCVRLSASLLLLLMRLREYKRWNCFNAVPVLLWKSASWWDAHARQTHYLIGVEKNRIEGEKTQRSWLRRNERDAEKEFQMQMRHNNEYPFSFRRVHFDTLPHFIMLIANGAVLSIKKKQHQQKQKQRRQHQQQHWCNQ